MNLVRSFLPAALLFLTSTQALAIQNEFLPNGGIRYTLTNNDFAFEQHTDSEGVRHIDTSTGWMNPGLCVTGGTLNSTLRTSLERLEQRVAAGATGDSLGNPASTVGDNLKYCLSNGQSTTLLVTTPVHFAAAGRVSVRITYSTKGLYAGIPDQGQLSAVELQRIFNAVLFLETFDEDDDDIGGGSSSIETVGGLPRVADLSRQTYGTGYGRRVVTSPLSTLTTTKEFDIDQHTTAKLKITNKAYGFWLRIEGIEMTYNPR